MLYSLLRPILFKLDPETAHHVTFSLLQKAHLLGLDILYSQSQIYDPVTIMGIKFPNRVGLAAGLDKDGKYLDTLGKMGFGFLEVGTVTPLPQKGNDKPRLFRLPEVSGVINRLGFNNEGVLDLANRIRQSTYTGILGINIGKNATTPIKEATQDYLRAMQAVYAYASYIAVNISSPNTKNLRDLQSESQLSDLLASLKHEQAKLSQENGLYRPIALKIAPDITEEQIRIIADLLKHHKIDGLIATNTTIERSNILHHPMSSETGGLSGEPLYEQSNWVIEQFYKHLGEDIPIIGVGGIMNGASAVRKLRAGAKLVQLYSGLLYHGPKLVTECAAALATNHSDKTLEKKYP